MPSRNSVGSRPGTSASAAAVGLHLGGTNVNKDVCLEDDFTDVPPIFVDKTEASRNALKVEMRLRDSTIFGRGPIRLCTDHQLQQGSVANGSNVQGTSSYAGAIPRMPSRRLQPAVSVRNSSHHRHRGGSAKASAAETAFKSEEESHRASQKDTFTSGVGGARVSLAPSALLAAHSTDPRRWLLALQKPPEDKLPVEEDRNATACSAVGASLFTYSSKEGVESLPLSERITIRELRTIMHAFSPTVDVETMLQEVVKARAPLCPLAMLPHGENGDLATSLRNRKQNLKSTVTTKARCDSSSGGGGGEHRHSEQVALPASKSNSLLNLTVVPNQLYSAPGVVAVEQNQSPLAVGSSEVMVHAPETDSTNRRINSLDQQQLKKGSCFGRSRVADSFCESGDDLSWRDRFFHHQSVALSTARGLTEWLRDEGNGTLVTGRSPSTYQHQGSVDAPASLNYSRHLPKDIFDRVMRTIITSATQEEVMELMNKVDYEAVGTISWNELATFLISQSCRTTFMAQASSIYNTSPDPPTNSVSNSHQLITCHTVEPRKKLVLTGGSEGTVRAWNISTLAYRGLVFSGRSWIVGLHYSHNARTLFIVTMEREVYVLDGNTLEVLRLYRGRALNESAPSMVYAHDTTRVVKVGGVVPLSERKAILMATQREKRIAAANAAAAAAAAAAARGDGSGGTPNPPAASSRHLKQQAGGRGYLSLRTEEAAPLTGCSTGPHVVRPVEEGVLTGIADAVTCTLYHCTILEEEVLLLGTTGGDVYIFAFNIRVERKVLLPHRVLHLHRGSRINKIELFFALDALLSCADDGTVRLTSMVNGQLLRTFCADSPVQHGSVRDFAVHPTLKMIVTVGSERHGLVWDITQESPIAVLAAHNSPCRCCAVNPRHNQIITIGSDGVVHVFDCHRFHLLQVVEPTCGSTQHRGQSIAVTEEQQSLTCFSTYPFRYRVKRQATSSSLMSKYSGHVATMLTSLYTRTFDQVVTCDAESMVMTWTRATGENVFAFTLRDFSASATMNAARLTCVALDGLQRRLLSGFHNGAVVAWNIVNGQAINFVTAGMTDDVFASPQSALGEPDAARHDSRPWRSALAKAPTHGKSTGGGETNTEGATKNKKQRPNTPGRRGEGVDLGDASVVSPASAAALQEVTAVGSLVRHDATFYLFAVGRTFYAAKEDPSTFTVAAARAWRIPEAYGDVLAITQVDGQVVACGTSTGALFFYHVLAERQEGAALYVPESLPSESGGFPATNIMGGGHHGRHTVLRESMTMGATMMNSMHRHSPQMSSTVRPAMSLTGAVSISGGGALANATTAHCVTSRIVRLIPLHSDRPHLLLSAHIDGTVALWQTFRRVYLGSVNLTSAGIQEAKDGSGAVVMDINASNEYLVFADEGGNVHVCDFRLRQLQSASEEVVAMALTNPALYLQIQEYAASHLDGAGESDTGTRHYPHTGGEGGKDKDEDDECETMAGSCGNVVGLDGAGTLGYRDVADTTTATAEDVSVSEDYSKSSTQWLKERAYSASAFGGVNSKSYQQERALHVFETFKRTCIFPSGLGTIASIIVLDPPEEEPLQEPRDVSATARATMRMGNTYAREGQRENEMTVAAPVGEYGSGAASLMDCTPSDLPLGGPGLPLPPPPSAAAAAVTEALPSSPISDVTAAAAIADNALSVIPRFAPINSDAEAEAAAAEAEAATQAARTAALQAAIRASPGVQREPIIICTSTENYSRAFTLRGEPIGELGVNMWTLSDPSTFRLLGEECELTGGSAIGKTTEAVKLASLSFLEDNRRTVEFDYLAETYAAQQQASLVANMRSSRFHRVRSFKRNSLGSIAVPQALSHSITMGTMTTGGIAGGTVGRSGSLGLGKASTVVASPLVATSSVEIVAGGGATLTPVPSMEPALASPVQAPTVPLAVPLRSLLTTTIPTFKAPPPTGDDDAAASGAPGDSTEAQQKISTLMKRSTRQRYVESRRYCGVVKRNFVDQVRQLAAVQLSHDVDSAGAVVGSPLMSDAGGKVSSVERGFLSLIQDTASPVAPTTMGGVVSDGNSSHVMSNSSTPPTERCSSEPVATEVTTTVTSAFPSFSVLPLTMTSSRANGQSLAFQLSGSIPPRKASPRRETKRGSATVTITSRPSTCENTDTTRSVLSDQVAQRLVYDSSRGANAESVDSPHPIVTSPPPQADPPQKQPVAFLLSPLAPLSTSISGVLPSSPGSQRLVVADGEQQPALYPMSSRLMSTSSPTASGSRQYPPHSKSVSPQPQLQLQLHEQQRQLQKSRHSRSPQYPQRYTLRQSLRRNVSSNFSVSQSRHRTAQGDGGASIDDAAASSINVLPYTDDVDYTNDPQELLRRHLEQRKERIVQNSVSQVAREGVLLEVTGKANTGDAASKAREAATGNSVPLSEDLGSLTPMNEHVNALLVRANKQKNGGTASMTSSARSYLAQVSAKLYVAPVAEIDAPIGSRSREDAKMWKDHLKRLQKRDEAHRGPDASQRKQ